MRTPYLRLRLPIIVRRVQRGEAKLVLDLSKLGEYLRLAPKDLDNLASLLSSAPVKKPRPTRKKINYIARKVQYERLLSDGVNSV